MIFCGVDPGLSGGIAFIREGSYITGPQEIECWVMPTVPGPRGKRELDMAAIAQMMSGAKGDGVVAIERAQVMSKQGVVSSGRIMENYGKIVGLLFGLHIPFVEVRPQAWQRSFGISSKNGDTKSSSVLVAQQLFPGVSLLATERCKKPHDGLSDSLLLAEWCRRTTQSPRPTTLESHG